MASPTSSDRVAGQPAVSAATPRSRCAVIGRGLLALFAVVAVLGAAAWFEREPLLRSAAAAWIVSDPLRPADAVAVFGGGLEDRPFAAADYYSRGLVKKIVISNVGATQVERLGVVESHVALNRDALLKLGVPASAIEVFGANLKNTRQEALALHDWARQEGVHSIIVPTESFVTRRLRWILHRVFGDDGDVRVIELNAADYGADNWWKTDAGIIAFQNEVLKYIYYRLKY
ncbi:MAG TPA: YdcF family protein [Stellaceae bacterium]|jgi:uncharacterized SAM-binding protein YcdF (DUF218 family)|nr:YdcF family protein [Stellaceae bacterium]